MAYTPTSFYVGSPSIGTTTLYTGPGGGAVLIVKEIVITNTTASSKTVNVWFVPSAGSPDGTNNIINSLSIAPGYPVVLALSSVIGPSDTIQANASSNSSVSIRISGVVGP